MDDAGPSSLWCRGATALKGADMSFHKTRRRSPARAVVFAIVALISMSAAEAKKFQINIAAGNALQTLIQFIEQTGFQVLYSPDAIRDHSTQSVSGEYEPNE